jgi:lipid-A-disaccharide synthase
MKMVRIFVSAGEPSGDMHAARLVRELKNLRSDLEFTGLGGRKLMEEGVNLTHTFEDFSIVGFQEAFTKLPIIKRVLRDLVKEARDTKLAILVDYPGFNLKLARHLKNAGIKTVYYIVPQVWAWGKWRVRILKKYIDLALVIFPFEEPFFKEWGINAVYVGHPILDLINEEDSTIERPNSKYVVGLLPGSRRDEIRRLLPKMLQIKRELEKKAKDITFILSLLSDIPDEVEGENLIVHRGEARSIMRVSDLLIAASGTVSLEAGLLGKPIIILYMLSELSWIIAKRLAKVPYISLVNILLNERVIPEFLQHIHPEEISETALKYLEDPETPVKMEKIKRKLENVLGKPGAVRRAAERIINEIE